ncbi:MAG: hypothetical protein AAGL18_00335 [Pseudomonadota bacterium]
MTSEVCLMNRKTVAMASDSAVTITGPGFLKTYQSEDKLFPLVEGAPVGVMIYNNAEIMSTPWETVISLYRDQMGGRTLDTIEAYGHDFMEFLSGNPELFPADHQDTEFFKTIAVVMTLVAEDFDEQIEHFKRNHEGASLRDHLSAIFEFVVGELHTSYQQYPDGSARSDLPCFPKGMDQQVRRRYAGEIDQLIESLIGALTAEHPVLSVSEDTRNRLRDIAVFSATRDAFFENYTGIVVAGFGARGQFPQMRSYLTSSVVLGILKRKQDRGRDMNADAGPVVETFAQDRMIRTFLTGMDPYLTRFMYGETLELSFRIVTDLIRKVPNMSDAERQAMFDDYSRNNLGFAIREFFGSVASYQEQVHTRPIYRAVGVLPKKELGETAAALINLNSFQQKVMNSIETVGGPVDVAVITRNGGLEMMKQTPNS